MCVFCLSRRQILGGSIASLLAPALTGCQVSPGTGSLEFNILSAEDEAKMGRESHPQILKEFGGAYDDPKVSAYVAGLGDRLKQHSEMPGTEFRFTVLNSQIVNAMALPGGYIYVTRGLLALVGDEAELAGVVGHEIGHVTARHTAQRYSRAMAANLGAGILGAVVGVPGVGNLASAGATYWLQAYSRDNELEADTLGVRYMSRTGYHADAMASMLDKLREESRLEALKAGRSPDSVDEIDMMATHPRTLDRVKLATKNALTEPPSGIYGVDPLLNSVDGLVYGDDISQGVIRGRTFLHPGDGFRFEVPPGFRLVNSPTAVIAKSQQGAAILFDGGRWRGNGDMVAYLARGWLTKAELSGLERIEINGFRAATAATHGRTDKGTVDIRAVAIAGDDQQVWRFLFATPPALTAQMAVDMRRTTYSFRAMSAEEKAAVRPWRVDVVTARAGDTPETLARRMAMEEFKVETFRTLNGLKANDPLQPGRRVKLIV